MVYFTDFFNIDKDTLESYGAFNISLINDLPLFIDPFLLFGSGKSEYKQLHKSIIDYLTFIKTKSHIGGITEGEIKSWFKFSEVKQNWLGFSVSGNGGSGLGLKFGKAMSANMHVIYHDLNNEEVTSSSHLEKAGLFQIGVGKDNISDFTCNLIKSYLLEYSQIFADTYLNDTQKKIINVEKVFFDYELERWVSKKFTLPYCNNDFIILTPKDILTKDDNWINSHELKGDFEYICNTIDNDQLRNDINNYFRSKLPAPVIVGKGKKEKEKEISQKDFSIAINETIQRFPEILDYYIKLKETNKEGAKSISHKNVVEVETTFIDNVSKLIEILNQQTNFYKSNATFSFSESYQRVQFLKDVIENKDGYRLFYVDGKPIKREADLQIIYRLTWYSSPLDVNREVNNGRGPVDYSVSMGAKDKTLVEFKLASNSKLKMNLENQVEVYEKASDTKQSIKVIMYFDENEYIKVKRILKELKLDNDKNIILIDAGNNKPSASNVK